jgi:hypothetical protein
VLPPVEVPPVDVDFPPVPVLPPVDVFPPVDVELVTVAPPAEVPPLDDFPPVPELPPVDDFPPIGAELVAVEPPDAFVVVVVDPTELLAPPRAVSVVDRLDSPPAPRPPLSEFSVPLGFLVVEDLPPVASLPEAPALPDSGSNLTQRDDKQVSPSLHVSLR